MLKITLGRDEKNNIVLRHDTVSSFHAYALMSVQQCQIVDLDSSNGTFINDRRISKFNLKKEDTLRLGGYNVMTKKLFEKLDFVYKKNKTDYRIEFKNLMETFKSYQEQKDKLLKRPLTPILIRLGLGIVFIVVTFLFDLDPNIRFSMIFLIGILSMAGSYLTPSNIKKNNAFAELKLKYEELLVCPRPTCKSKMIKENLTYWKGRKTCPNCSARYQ